MSRLTERMILSAALGFALAAHAGAQVLTERVTPYLVRSDPQEWVLTTTVSLYANHLAPGQDGPLIEAQEFKIEQATIFFPMPLRSASHDRERNSISASLLFVGREVPMQKGFIDTDSARNPIHSGEVYSTWLFKDVKANLNMIFKIESRVTCWNTEFDESLAMKVPWPTGTWPKEAASTFEPELFINEDFEGAYETDSVARLAERLTKGKVKNQPPMVAAKWLAGEIARSFQPSKYVSISDARPATARQSGQSVGATSAYEVIGAEEAARRGKGTEFDMALLLVAVYREVGLPARLVFGHATGGNLAENSPFRGSDKAEPGPYAWVEVALYDESQARPDQQLTWVPVDIVRIREERSFGRKLDQPWPGFGTSDNLNEIVPVAFHMHPHRVGASSYGGSQRDRLPRPSIWGWNVVPETPQGIEQVISFSATSPSRGPGDPPPGKRDPNR